MEQLWASLSMAAVYAVTVAAIVAAKYPLLLGRLWGHVVTMFFGNSNSREPKRVERHMRNAPSLGETIASTSDPTLASTSVASSERRAAAAAETTVVATTRKPESSGGASSSSSSSSPDLRKNVRFGSSSLLSIAEKSREGSEKATIVANDPLKFSTHSTRSSNSKVSFAATAPEVIPQPPCPRHTPTTKTAPAPAVFCLDSIQPQRSITRRRPDDASNSQSESSQSRRSAQHEPATTSCIPWRMGDDLSVSSSTKEEATITSENLSKGRADSSQSTSTMSHGGGGGGGSTRSHHLSSRLRTRLTNGPKVSVSAVTTTTSTAKKKLSDGATLLTGLETDSMRSSSLSSHMDYQSGTARVVV